MPYYSSPIGAALCPLLPYKTISLTYDDVKAVESRSEIYREAIIPVLMRSTSIVTQDGERHVLGYTKEKATDPAFPFSEISHEIAMRSGLPLNERGTIHAGGQYLAAIKGPPFMGQTTSLTSCCSNSKESSSKILVDHDHHLRRRTCYRRRNRIMFRRIGVEGFAQ